MWTDDAQYLPKGNWTDGTASLLLQYRRPVGRTLQTNLTDDDIKDCGLLVLTKVDRSDLLDVRFDATRRALPGEQWLVRGPANDRQNRDATRHDWLPIFERRLEDLRQIAREESLPFDEVSAAAAMAFLLTMPATRQPGTFLVDGNIRLLWDAPTGEQVGLQFRGSNKVQFLILQSEGGELGSTMGVRSTAAVLRLLAAPDIAAIMSR